MMRQRKRPSKVAVEYIHDRFWMQVDRTDLDGCWPWAAGRISTGYGGFTNGNEFRMLAHRYAYTDVFGPIPQGLFVLHACDNPICVNPLHLSLGTQTDNMRDASRKGRCKFNPLRGEHSPHAKLTTEQVAEIRSLKGAAPATAYAQRFGVEVSAIRRIWRGVSWKDVL